MPKGATCGQPLCARAEVGHEHPMPPREGVEVGGSGETTPVPINTLLPPPPAPYSVGRVGVHGLDDAQWGVFPILLTAAGAPGSA